MYLIDPSYLSGKRVLMIMADFFAMHQMIINGLHDVGAEVDYFDERPSNSFMTKALIRLNPALLRRSITRYYTRIAEETRNVHYDYVFFIKGECVPESALSLLRRYHPEAKFVLYEWDSVVYYEKQFDRIRPYFDKLVSFDRFDSEKYGMQFVPSFYDKAYAEVADMDTAPVYDMMFVGTVHSDRYDFVNKVSRIMHSYGKSVYTYYYMQHRLVYLKSKYIDRNIYNDKDVTWHYDALNLKELSQVYAKSRIILEVPRPQQRGLTFRSIEALGARRKLITTNPDIVNYDFYDPDNILVVDRESPQIPLDFITTPYHPLPQEIYDRYTITNWLANMFA